MSRLESLQELAKLDPNNTLIRYGIAMEHKNGGNLGEAVQAFEEVLKINENYAAAYFHGGQALEQMGRVDDAKAMYQRGIAATERTGDGHTKSELQAALDLLP